MARAAKHTSAGTSRPDPAGSTCSPWLGSEVYDPQQGYYRPVWCCPVCGEMILAYGQPEFCPLCNYRRPSRFAKDYAEQVREAHRAASRRIDGFRKADGIAGEAGCRRRLEAVHDALKMVGFLCDEREELLERDAREASIARATKHTSAGTSRHPEPHGETTGGRVTPARPNDEGRMAGSTCALFRACLAEMNKDAKEEE